MSAGTPLAHNSLDSPALSSPIASDRTSHPSRWHLTRAQRDVLAGSAGGLVSKACEYPADLIKTRLQTQASFAYSAVPASHGVVGTIPASSAAASVGASPKTTTQPPSQASAQGRPFSTAATRSGPIVRMTGQYSGALDCFSQIVRDEGMRGLYRGLSMPLQGAILENASLFLTYNAVTQALAPSLAHPDGSISTAQAALAGGAAGAAVSLFLTPVELVKCQLQVQQAAARLSISRGMLPPGTKLPGPMQIFPSIVQKEGMRGLWLGLSATLGREAIGDAAWFLTFDVVTRSMCQRRDQGLTPLFSLDNLMDRQAAAPRQLGKHTRRDLDVTEVAAAGALSGVSYILVSYPIDCVKANVQTSRVAHQHQLPSTARAAVDVEAKNRPGFFAMARCMYGSQGARAFVRGLGITAARSAPSSALILYVAGSRPLTRF